MNAMRVQLIKNFEGRVPGFVFEQAREGFANMLIRFGYGVLVDGNGNKQGAAIGIGGEHNSTAPKPVAGETASKASTNRKRK